LHEPLPHYVTDLHKLLFLQLKLSADPDAAEPDSEVGMKDEHLGLLVSLELLFFGTALVLISGKLARVDEVIHKLNDSAWVDNLLWLILIPYGNTVAETTLEYSMDIDRTVIGDIICPQIALVHLP